MTVLNNGKKKSIEQIIIKLTSLKNRRDRSKTLLVFKELCQACTSLRMSRIISLRIYNNQVWGTVPIILLSFLNPILSRIVEHPNSVVFNIS